MWLYILLAILAAILYKDNNYEWIFIIAKTYRRDIILAKAYFLFHLRLWWWSKRHETVSSLFTRHVKRNPQKIAFYFENDVWTFAQVENYSNQVARYFKEAGFKKGDTIALFMENNVEYVCLWLGLSKIGVVSALINTNLMNKPLMHTINSVQCKALIFGSNLTKSVQTVYDELNQLELYQFNEQLSDTKELLQRAVDLKIELKSVSENTVKLSNEEKVNEKDSLIYIYTSGTTGLPKAARISNLRFIFMSVILNMTTRMDINDNIYTPLPLYHASGVMLGVGQTLISGLTCTFRKKFSASNYFKDCVKYKCTIAQYIGEMCRYVLSSSASVADAKNHRLRFIVGNGLKPQIWTKFVDTFGIPEVREFYGATEGNSNFINVDNKIGSVGAIPRYADFIYPVISIKCDLSTGEPIRDSIGRCTKCKYDEPGLLIGKINQKKAISSFEGYSDKKATEKKILRDVFTPGDIYFNSGDVLVRDKYGYIFFKDRTGDTFRWKGENVSTAEVEGVISSITKSDSAVYGVEIPHTEGRAGMAAIADPNGTLDLDVLSAGLNSNLPTYAIPLFIRVMDSLPMTTTFKVQKVQLQPQGFDVNQIKDALYLYNPKTKKYSALTVETHQQIMDAKLNL